VAEVLLPLFPLEVVLLPEAPLPLHVFEDRYKRMIGECLEAQSRGSDREEFGVVLAREGEMQKVGCSARILEVTRRYDDGRLDILTAGIRRFEVLYTTDEKPYLEGGVVFFDDAEESEAPTDKETQRVRDMLREFVRRTPQALEVPIDLPGPGDYYLLPNRRSASGGPCLQTAASVSAQRGRPAAAGRSSHRAPHQKV